MQLDVRKSFRKLAKEFTSLRSVSETVLSLVGVRCAWLRRKCVRACVCVIIPLDDTHKQIFKSLNHFYIPTLYPCRSLLGCECDSAVTFKKYLGDWLD